MIGEFDLAVERIEFLLSLPGELSVPLLRRDPIWAPLHNHPRFKRLLEAENQSGTPGEREPSLTDDTSGS
jgi:hypothetical protein